jgi:hypothetical protein
MVMLDRLATSMRTRCAELRQPISGWRSNT